MARGDKLCRFGTIRDPKANCRTRRQGGLGRVQDFMAEAARIDKLDGLRGLAISTIIILHWYIFPFRTAVIDFSPTLYSFLDLMRNSVDLFFVNSGFLIGSILLSHCDSNNFLKAFYIRRFYRIVPFYYLILASMLFKVTHGAWQCDGNPAPYFSFYIFINNLFASIGHCSPQELGPTWSLAIEEQFYFTGAMTAVLFGRRGIVIYGFVLAATAPVARALVYGLDLPVDYWLFSPTHMDSIGIGIITASVVKTPRFNNWVAANMRQVYRVAGACLCFYLLTPVLPLAVKVVFQITAIGIVTGSVILIVLHRDGAEFLRFKPLVAAGRTCFSLFLLHQIVLLWTYSFAVELGLHYAWGFASALPVLCLMVYLTWTYIETPLIARGRRHRYVHDAEPVYRSSTA